MAMVLAIALSTIAGFVGGFLFCVWGISRRSETHDLIRSTWVQRKGKQWPN